MKKLIALLLVMIMSMSVFTACGGDNSSASGEGDVNQQVGDTEQFEEENKYDLSIYPSKNIEIYNGVMPELLTYDEMFARIESQIVTSETQEFDGTIIHMDANDNNIHAEFMEDGAISALVFNIYDENGMELEEYWYEAKGDAKPYQIYVKDINGQDIYRVNETGDGSQRFTVIDYHANGVLAREVSYKNGMLESDDSYNEKGEALDYISYRDGVEYGRISKIYDDKNLLQKEESYYEGELEAYSEYFYTSDSLLERIDAYVVYEGTTMQGGYELYTYNESGELQLKTEYRITNEAEGMLYMEGILPTEDSYAIYRETEYFANGNRKMETVYDDFYIEVDSGVFEDAVKVVTEYYDGEYDSMVSKCTAYDDKGNSVIAAEYDEQGNLTAGKYFYY